MIISDILSEDMVLTEVEAVSKRQLLEKISSVLAQKKRLDKNSVFEAIWERENLGSTGYGKGVAFPHARMAGIDKVVSVFARLQHGLDYDTPDNTDVDLVAMMISPENSGDDHLKTLAAFSRVLKNADVCREIRSAKSAHEIYTALQR
ncbi:MAG: PTS sugar transporter subunit IIA [Alphaproteobacteria bacterium]|nr:PTS sugar transporter subunit IIA [Alphaproteobacteria bacterium]